MLARCLAQLGIDDAAGCDLENVGIQRAPAPGLEGIVERVRSLESEQES